MARFFLHPISIIISLFLFSCLLIYGYFYAFYPERLKIIYQNWDGPSYVIIAKTLYDADKLAPVNTIDRPASYFAAHYPLFPVLIRGFSFLGYFQASIFVSQLATILFLIAFYYLARIYTPKNALWLSLFLCLFPGRFFIVSHVASSEPLFLLFITLSIYSYKKNNLWVSAIFGAFAQLTRAQGILFFAGYFCLFLYQILSNSHNIKANIIRFVPYLLIPLSLLALFIFYYFRLGDFLAFFHALSEYRHLEILPFQAFKQHNFWGQFDSWKEIYIIYWLIYLTSVISLFKNKKYELAFPALFFFLPMPFLIHEDIGRYSLPLLPFAVLALEKGISTIEVKLSTILLFPAVLFFTYYFILSNRAL